MSDKRRLDSETGTNGRPKRIAKQIGAELLISVAIFFGACLIAAVAVVVWFLHLVGELNGR